jgi:hypothetical protein
MSAKRLPPQALALGALLIAVPLAGGIFLLTRGGPGDARVSIPQDLVTDSTWANGQPRVLSRARTEGTTVVRTICARAADGRDLACGELRDDVHWNGSFIDWILPGRGDPIVGGIRRFRDGKRQGLWQTFARDGTVLVEMDYEADRLLQRRVRTADGQLRAPTLPEHMPKGALPVTPEESRR